MDRLAYRAAEVAELLGVSESQVRRWGTAGLLDGMLGHSSVNVTDRIYRHRVEQLQREAADAMQRAVG